MKIEAYAKVNLFLEVLGRRSDGYHALRSLVAPVSLSDTVEVEPVEDGTLTSDAPFPDDLCLRSAKALQAHCGVSCGARIRVEKRIPVGGGLGGGSADAAATLIALNQIWKLGLSREELAGVGAAVGSDVPALTLGGPVLMEGRGEVVTRFPALPKLHIVIANPGVFTSTRAVYEALAKSRTSPIARGADFWYHMQTALERGDLEEIASAMVNDLASPAQTLNPQIAEAAAALRDAGAVGVTVSGSGSSVFGLVPSEARGCEIAALLRTKGLAAWSVLTPVP